MIFFLYQDTVCQITKQSLEPQAENTHAVTSFTIINSHSIFEQLLVSKWIANLDSTIILWKKVSFGSRMVTDKACAFHSQNIIKKYIFKVWKIINLFFSLIMTCCMNRPPTRKQRARKICIWICQNNKVWEKKSASLPHHRDV